MSPKSKASKKPVSEKTALVDNRNDTSGYQVPTKGILSKLPASWVPYAELIRLEQPHGNYMIYFPHIVGLMYATAIRPTPVSVLVHRAGIFAIWTFFMRGAGCAWNDNVDQEFDRKTARCRVRPIARGAVSTTQGHIFTLLLVLAGFASIATLPIECTYVGIGTTILSTIYPFGKRFTNFAQVILGSTLASTIALSAYSIGLPALNSHYIIPTLCLSATIMLLVVFYDVVYARQDTADDLKSGVKGMAVRFRNHLEGLFAVITISIAGFLTTLGGMVGMGHWYYVFSVGGLTFGLVSMIALTHWQLLPSWAGKSGYAYAFAILSLLTGFIVEYCVKDNVQ
ncbi:UbiA prenyltransferase family-domain-containing protein [Emericellopsis atlantica]|uniref:UbiA prenyltransferase family-domain-containing protein n=1 Tax=Emericellopsis atlantica TaxID=2614577 RepID=A0A9P8CTM7_9HYPO|nr:UbiA prenyltransferase family-domain-containing protein [Emericellopsis atlantica]KAG9258405.1 UbiA prenyltransferase family-domain-containing protein [Emericellopsis atlantica]